MIDAILPLAFTVHANKGATALLLGSGVSRSAGIPTGWEVTLDLVRKLAVTQGEPEPTDPKAWYLDKFSEEPGYDRILELLAPSPSQRHALVRGYFEPTEEEREDGLKAPTKAHRAIADLVAKGYVRVIITTNFDRLMEAALQDVGVAPTVVTNVDGLKGATPLPHVRCLLLKVHGDYHDTRILNSPQELAAYDDAMARYVTRIAEDFGLVVSGWSGEYDEALRAALVAGRASASYPLYWSSRGDIGAKAREFLQVTKGAEIPAKGADEFFQDLRDKVQALEDLAGPRPMTTAVAVATAKRFLASNEGRIRFHDLVTSEAKRTVEALHKVKFLDPNAGFTPEQFREVTRDIEKASTTLIHLFALGAYWAAPPSSFVHALSALGNLSRADSGLTSTLRFRLYPPLLCYYATGVASVLLGSFGLFRVLGDVEVHGGAEAPARLTLHAQEIVEQGLGRQWEGMERHRTPTSDRCLAVIGPAFEEFAPNRDVLVRAFDLFEFLVAMEFADRVFPDQEVGPTTTGRVYVPVGAFTWRTADRSRRRDLGLFTSVAEQVVLDLQENAKEQWPPLKAGMFGGDVQRAIRAATNVDRAVATNPRLHW